MVIVVVVSLTLTLTLNVLYPSSILCVRVSFLLFFRYVFFLFVCLFRHQYQIYTFIRQYAYIHEILRRILFDLMFYGEWWWSFVIACYFHFVVLQCSKFIHYIFYISHVRSIQYKTDTCFSLFHPKDLLLLLYVCMCRLFFYWLILFSINFLLLFYNFAHWIPIARPRAANSPGENSRGWRDRT